MRGALILWACFAIGMLARGQDIDSTKFTFTLLKYVTSDSCVNYAQLKADGIGDLDSYLSDIAKPWPEGMNADASKAALINAYNALTIRWIVTHFPIESIWRTKNPFKFVRHKVNGKLESLDSIETRLRDMGDPRIHAVLVCAARSCPPLRREAYSKSTLNDRLDDNSRMWLAEPSRNQFLPDKKLAKVSKIFEWYAGDFTKAGGVQAFLQKFAPPNSFDVSNKLEYQKYNWGVNDTGSVGASYSGFEFSIDWVRNGYRRADAGIWFLGLGKRYGVDPLIFGTIYIGAIPFFSLSIAWLIRNLRRGRSTVLPLLAAGFCFVSAYLYLLVAGKNIPIWVYLFLAGMLVFGVWSTVRKVKSQVASA